MKKRYIDIVNSLMRIDTSREYFNILHIDNRRFMFNPQTGTLILGYPYKGKKIVSSHAEEHANADTGEPYDLFLRGWIGADKRNYKNGVIHFAPSISSDNAEMFSRGFDTLEMFKENGANKDTVVRGFGRTWEQSFSDLIKEVDTMATKKETNTITAESPTTTVTPIVLESDNMRDKVKEITDKLEQGIKDLFDSEKYKAFLDTMAKFHRYSYNNSLLIMFQKPDASAVAGYTDWVKKFHRYVRKGEKGIKILAPAPYKKDIEVPVLDGNGNHILGADGNKLYNAETITVPAFKVTTVFDVSQTEGEPLPSISSKLEGNVENYEKFFKALKEISPVPIELEKIESAANGYFNPVEKRIAIRDDLFEMQTIKTAIHEIAHAKLHALPDPNDKDAEVDKLTRNTKEVQAESVAYTVCQRFGLDTSDYSFGYIAGWSSGRDTKELKESLKVIRSTAAEIISGIEQRMPELTKEQEKMNETPEPPKELPTHDKKDKTKTKKPSIRKQLDENKQKCKENGTPKKATRKKSKELEV